jgi:hypothetical protein
MEGDPSPNLDCKTVPEGLIFLAHKLSTLEGSKYLKKSRIDLDSSKHLARPDLDSKSIPDSFIHAALRTSEQEKLAH